MVGSVGQATAVIKGVRPGTRDRDFNSSAGHVCVLVVEHPQRGWERGNEEWVAFRAGDVEVFFIVRLVAVEVEQRRRKQLDGGCLGALRVGVDARRNANQVAHLPFQNLCSDTKEGP